jgi:hypothetical protein
LDDSPDGDDQAAEGEFRAANSHPESRLSRQKSKDSRIFHSNEFFFFFNHVMMS